MSSSSATIDTVEAPPASAAPPRQKPQLVPVKPKPQPPYAVVLLDDDDHTFEYVIEVLQRVFGYELEQAFTLTKQVHEEGQAVVWSGSLEVAELKREQVQGFGPDFYASKTVRYALGVRIMPQA
jgi:ATP-dependent Clp protease adaptor protein ClpS